MNKVLNRVWVYGLTWKCSPKVRSSRVYVVPWTSSEATIQGRSDPVLSPGFLGHTRYLQNKNRNLPIFCHGVLKIIFLFLKVNRGSNFYIYLRISISSKQGFAQKNWTGEVISTFSIVVKLICWTFRHSPRNAFVRLAVLEKLSTATQRRGMECGLQTTKTRQIQCHQNTFRGFF